MADTINGMVVEMLRGAKEVGADIYNATHDAIVSGVDFAQEQAPLVVKEFLTWRAWESGLHLIFAVLSLVGVLIGAYVAYKWLKKANELKTEPVSMLYAVGAAVIVVVSLVWIPGTFKTIKQSSMALVKIKVAPRVYLIEYVSEQVTLLKASNTKKEPEVKK
jgi:hypothetical protein